jgi:hypothetical protein
MPFIPLFRFPILVLVSACGTSHQKKKDTLTGVFFFLPSEPKFDTIERLFLKVSFGWERVSNAKLHI